MAPKVNAILINAIEFVQALWGYGSRPAELKAKDNKKEK
jgi:hypothetical protein